MARKRVSRRRDKQRAEKSKAIRNLAIGIALLGVPIALFFNAKLGQVALDEGSLCPANPESITILLVDVTDPMNLPQRQDFANQLDKIITSIPKHGELTVVSVDPISDRLLKPVITRCNPGSGADESEWTGNPKQLERMRAEKFKAPLRAAFENIAEASGADRSPILESIQSVNLTELQSPGREGIPKRLIVASDLLQNTDNISFYKGLPAADSLIASQAFRHTRTDLRDVEVQFLMLERNDSKDTQPRALVDLWMSLVKSEGGNVTYVYRVSG